LPGQPRQQPSELPSASSQTGSHVGAGHHLGLLASFGLHVNLWCVLQMFRAEDTVVINERIRKRQVPEGSHIAASSRKIVVYCGRRAGAWSTSHVLPASGGE
jgi:hypothetical protein